MKENTPGNPEMHKLENFFNPMKSKDQLLRTTAALITIPSIMIELPDNENQKFANIQKVITTQISRQNWTDFFNIIAGFNFQNFDIIQWIKGDIKGEFNLDQEPEPRNNQYSHKKEFFTLNQGKSSTHHISIIEDVIKRHDIKGQLQFGWYLAIQRFMIFPPAIREVYIEGTTQIYRKLDAKLIEKKKSKRMSLFNVPTGYEIAQEVEDWVMEEDKVTVHRIETPQKMTQLPVIYKILERELKEDYYK
jgi:hypothetical protein